MIKKTKFIVTAFILSLIVSLCVGMISSAETAQEPEPETRNFFAMDTYMTLTAYGEHADEALDAAEKEITRLDNLLSTGNPESEIYLLNQKGSAQLSADSSYLMERSLEVNAMTDGAFNPLIYPLMEAWGFTDKNYKVPDEETITDLLALLDLSNVSFDVETGDIRFETEGMKIDFGGIAKGYTSARVIRIFQEYGVEYAVISLGGNVQVLGNKPNGNPWRVAIQDPYDGSSYIGILSTSDCAVITSGGYERNFEENGVVYHHILDPATGHPANQGLVSVTIVSQDGALADGVSTSLYVMGLEKAMELWRENSDLFDCILLTADNTVYVTEGIYDQFTSYYANTQIIQH